VGCERAAWLSSGRRGTGRRAEAAAAPQLDAQRTRRRRSLSLRPSGQRRSAARHPSSTLPPPDATVAGSRSAGGDESGRGAACDRPPRHPSGPACPSLSRTTSSSHPPLHLCLVASMCLVSSCLMLSRISKPRAVCSCSCDLVIRAPADSLRWSSASFTTLWLQEVCSCKQGQTSSNCSSCISDRPSNLIVSVLAHFPCCFAEKPNAPSRSANHYS